MKKQNKWHNSSINFNGYWNNRYGKYERLNQEIKTQPCEIDSDHTEIMYKMYKEGY